MKEEREFFEEDYVNQSNHCRKHIAVVHVYDIITQNTSSRKSFSTSDIIDRLDEYPYSLRIERRAVSDIITVLAAEYPFIHKDNAGKVWCERTYKKAG